MTTVFQWKPMRGKKEFQQPSHCPCYQREFKISAEAGDKKWQRAQTWRAFMLFRKFKLLSEHISYTRLRVYNIPLEPFKDEAQIALFKDPVPTAL